MSSYCKNVQLENSLGKAVGVPFAGSLKGLVIQVSVRNAISRADPVLE